MKRAGRDFHSSTLPLAPMKRLGRGLACAALLAAATPASAHPAPFSYVDLVLTARSVDVTVSAHIFDVAHDLGIDSSERLLDPSFATGRASDVAALLRARFRVEADGEPIACEPDGNIEIASARQSLKLHFACALKH